MSFNKRILSCIIVLIFLAAVCFIGCLQRETAPAVETSVAGEGNESGKKVALTFDDGPHPYYTEQLLKGLNERNAKATFFITGKNVEAYPEIVKKIHDNGHLIGNHTYNHT